MSDVTLAEKIAAVERALQLNEHILPTVPERTALEAVLADLREQQIWNADGRSLRAEAYHEGAEEMRGLAVLRKAELAIATLSITANRPRVIVTNETILPVDCTRIKLEPDLAIIRDRLRTAGTVPGAMLGNGSETLTIRVK